MSPQKRTKGIHMKFISSCYWQQGENDSTLLLQQYLCGRQTVLFACVCAGESTAEGVAGGYLSKQLLDWFRGRRLTWAVRKPELFFKRQAARLEQLLERTDRELAEAGLLTGRGTSKTAASLAGVLCLGRECLIFGRGNTEVLLLNRCMGRACAERVPKSESLYLKRGVMEQDIGLLLATDSFANRIPKKLLEEGLFVEEVLTERQAEKHLQELGEVGEKENGRNMAAVLLYTRGEL